VPTIEDVAKRAGVSLGTVSRVINDKKNVNPSTREKVERAVAELGYVPNLAARSLRSKQTYALALLVPDITNPFWTTVSRGVEDAAQSGGYSVLLCNTDENLEKQLSYLDLIIRQRVDGVIIAPFDTDAVHLKKLLDQNIPAVLIDRRITNWDGDAVYADSISGSIAIIQHLIRLGHRRIAMISGPQGTSTAQDRLAGYTLALKKAGIPVDPRLIKRGEYRSSSGEALTLEILDEGLAPTAIFAANNVIAMGVLEALEKRGLEVPKDVALVCFDELPDASRLFPFLTVVAQPAYDMGMNAAQLLISRLSADAGLKPRQVVLPPRLILRHSCGRSLKYIDPAVYGSIQALRKPQAHIILVKPLSKPELRELSTELTGLTVSFPDIYERAIGDDKSDIQRLLRTFNYEQPDRVPYLETQIINRAVYEYILERVPEEIPGYGITPENRLEFAQRLGMDALDCDLSLQPSSAYLQENQGNASLSGRVSIWNDLESLLPPASLASRLSFLERHLRAVQGTGVGVYLSFNSFFDQAEHLLGSNLISKLFDQNRSLLEKFIDGLLSQEEKVMRSVCDRFATDLAFVMIHDHAVSHANWIWQTALFQNQYIPRLERQIAAAKEHGKPIVLDLDGKIKAQLPVFHRLGIRIILGPDLECDEILESKKKWAGELAFIGGFPLALLVRGERKLIEEKVKELCIKLAPGSGWVLSSTKGITEDVPPENFLAMVRAVHKFGRYSSLGND
jgi:LacI family transcriptional regulator